MGNEKIEAEYVRTLVISFTLIFTIIFSSISILLSSDITSPEIMRNILIASIITSLAFLYTFLISTIKKIKIFGTFEVILCTLLVILIGSTSISIILFFLPSPYLFVSFGCPMLLNNSNETSFTEVNFSVTNPGNAFGYYTSFFEGRNITFWDKTIYNSSYTIVLYPHQFEGYGDKLYLRGIGESSASFIFRINCVSPAENCRSTKNMWICNYANISSTLLRLKSSE